MSVLAATTIAPLVRGLFLGATGFPVVVKPIGADRAGSGRMMKSAGPARPGAPGKPAGRGSPIVLALSAAALAGDGSFDESKAAAELARRFAEAASGASPRLPAFVDVILGGERLSFGVESLSATAERSALTGLPDPNTANSALGRSSVVAGKVALVTGGAQGFGAEIVRGLAASGAFVYIADLNLAGAAALAEELSTSQRSALAEEPRAAAPGAPALADEQRAANLGAGTFPIGVDVTDEASVSAMFDQVAAVTGGLDLIVSNAGVLKAASVLEQDEKSFRFVTDVNYTGFFFMAKHGGRLLRRQWRTAPRWMTDIVQINSKSGLQGSNKNGAYAGSKFGSIGLVQSFALEFVQYGIKVNAICPGNFFDGPLWSDPKSGLFVQYLESGKVPGAKTIADVRTYYEAKVPMGRGTAGTDVMRALYYLVEQEYETGQALPVTGGQVMLS